MKMKRSYLLISTLVVLSIVLGLGIHYRYRQQDSLILKPIAFKQLPGWTTDDSNIQQSLSAFQISCKAFLNASPEKSVGSGYLSLTAEDWQPICRAALKISVTDSIEAKAFFQQWFTPLSFQRQGSSLKGLFTGYYVPVLKGSLIKTPTYNVPIYGLPADLISVNLEHFIPSLKGKKLVGRLSANRMVPYYSRQQINQGALEEKAPVIAWIESPIDRVFLEIQGSGIIQLADGQELNVGYAGENGLPYTSIAKVLIERGILTKDKASMQAIKHYLASNPTEIDAVLNENKSFVFFNLQNQKAALGTQGVPLTAGYSLAVDRRWIPIGAPLWLNTTVPDNHKDDGQSLKRLMIAQDTGGAIRGVIRGDVFWGSGEIATHMAGHMKNPGNYWLLLPKPVVARLTQQHLVFQDR
ncbi:MAG: MltA domain-containing protein [Legionella sp.]|nr:MltA domain-containing protein [Legionella sp.]